MRYQKSTMLSKTSVKLAISGVIVLLAISISIILKKPEIHKIEKPLEIKLIK
jgi:hypothetical protein